jgi:DNA-binding transcriptional MerR regulator
MMIAQRDRRPIQERSGTERVYAPNLLPRLQALLADLADLELEHGKILEALRRSPAEDAHTQEMITRLGQVHDEQRAPYVRELMALQQQIEADFMR